MAEVAMGIVGVNKLRHALTSWRMDVDEPLTMMMTLLAPIHFGRATLCACPLTRLDQGQVYFLSLLSTYL